MTERLSASDRRGLIAAIAAIAVAATAFGHSLPLFSILLDSYGAGDFVIGLNASTSAIAAILGTPFFPRIIARIGLKPFLMICIGIMVATYGGLYLAGDAIPLWYPLRFMFGLGGAGMFVASEIWINTLAPATARGKIIGLYSTFLALGFAMGPLLVTGFGTDGAIPFLIGMAIFASAALPILWASAPESHGQEDGAGFFKLLPTAPAIFLSAALFAGVESAVLVFLPVLTIDAGLGQTAGVLAVTIYGLGIVVFQMPIGLSADRLGHNQVLLFCAGGSAILAGLFWALGPSPLWPVYGVLFFWGGLLAGLYTSGLIMIGEQFRGPHLAPANTGYVFMYGVGAILGPFLAGTARTLSGNTGWYALIFAILALYAVLVVIRRRQATP